VCVGCDALSAGRGPRVLCQISGQNAVAVTAPPKPPIIPNHLPLHHQRLLKKNAWKLHVTRFAHLVLGQDKRLGSGSGTEPRRGGNRTTTNIRRMPKGHHIPNNIICFCGPLKRFSPHFSFLILFCVQQANNAQVALTKKRKQGSKFQVLQRIIRMLIYTNMLNPPIYIFSHQQS